VQGPPNEVATAVACTVLDPVSPVDGGEGPVAISGDGKTTLVAFDAAKNSRGEQPVEVDYGRWRLAAAAAGYPRRARAPWNSEEITSATAGGS
jgi:hypothetical protein